MLKTLLVLGVALSLGACASGNVVQLTDKKISGPKIVALDAPSAPWVAQINMRLRQKGFTTKRFSRNEDGALTNEAARYVLLLDGAYFPGWEYRCFGGGYQFEFLTAELVDITTNEAILMVTGEGYSENCPPLSGTIFGDIAEAVNSAWQ